MNRNSIIGNNCHGGRRGPFDGIIPTIVLKMFCETRTRKKVQQNLPGNWSAIRTGYPLHKRSQCCCQTTNRSSLLSDLYCQNIKTESP
jgi:hypothetical protein